MNYREIHRRFRIKDPKNVIDFLRQDRQYSGLSHHNSELALFFLLGDFFFEDVLTGIVQVDGNIGIVKIPFMELLRFFESVKVLTKVIVLHNHPNGSLIASEQDLKWTDSFNDCLNYTHKTRLACHIILGREWEFNIIWENNNHEAIKNI